MMKNGKKTEKIVLKSKQSLVQIYLSNLMKNFIGFTNIQQINERSLQSITLTELRLNCLKA